MTLMTFYHQNRDNAILFHNYNSNYSWYNTTYNLYFPGVVKQIMSKAKTNNDIITNMFVPAAISMVLSVLARFLAVTIDGIITSKFFGPDAYSGISLFNPIVNIILLFATFISIGCQVLSSRQIGEGKKEEANAVFSFAIIMGLIIALVFIILSLFTPDFLFHICGIKNAERPEIYQAMRDYLKGYIWGIPALILVQVLSPFVIMDNGKKLATAAAVVLFFSDVVGDLMNVFVFHGGVLGMGLATTVSLVLQLLVLLAHFLRSHGYFAFSMKGFHISYVIEIIKNGGLTFIRTLATILRDLFTNHLNLSLAISTAAVAAKGIQTDINTLMFSLGIGIGQALLPMTAMFYAADDRKGLRRLFICSMKTSIISAGVTGIVMFLAAPLISIIYTNDPEVASLATFSIRCMAVGLIMDTVAVAFQNYLQGIARLTVVNIICFAERFFVPIIVAFVMGRLFGTKGILASLAVGKFVLVIVLYIIICICKKGLAKHLDDFMLLPEDYGIEEGAELYSCIKTIDDAVAKSEEARKFCLSHGADRKKANLMSLYVEEMGKNIIIYGKPKHKNKVNVDFRLYYKDGKFCMSLRDYCEAFNPEKYYEIHKNDSPEKNLGIRIILKSAQDIRYINTFNSNCTIILMS